MVGVAFALVLVTVIVPATGIFRLPELPPAQPPAVRGTVTNIVETGREATDRGEIRAQRIDVETDSGSVTVNRSFVTDAVGVLDVGPGDTVLLGKGEGSDRDIYFLADHVRDTPMYVLALAFLVVVLIVGRARGILSVVGLVASFFVIVRFVIPGVLSGHSPIVIALIGAFVIMLVTLYPAHGVNRKTNVAFLGTAASLVFATVIATVSIKMAVLSGIAADDAVTLHVLSNGRINAQGLLLGGIIIGALGVLEDMTIGQASSVFELRRANPRLRFAELYRRGMNVGRDHIASAVYTLVLAYAGVSLPLLIILSIQTEPLGTLVNREFLATEVVRTLIGSLGIVVAVPITTALAAYSAHRVPVFESAHAPAYAFREKEG